MARPRIERADGMQRYRQRVQQCGARLVIRLRLSLGAGHLSSRLIRQAGGDMDLNNTRRFLMGL